MFVLFRLCICEPLSFETRQNPICNTSGIAKFTFISHIGFRVYSF